MAAVSRRIDVVRIFGPDGVRRSQRLANMEQHGKLHILRHTFCSRLAMRGATAKAIQELAGHSSLTTTQRYMHLSPAHKEGAIRLLEGEDFVEIMETVQGNDQLPCTVHHLRGVPNGVRTRVAGVKGRYPGPLDDGDQPGRPKICFESPGTVSQEGLEPSTNGLKGHCSTN